MAIPSKIAASGLEWMELDQGISHRERLEGRPFLLGLFYPTMSGGWIMSRAGWPKRREQSRWSYLSDLARRADRFGLDYLFMGMAYPTYQASLRRPFDFRAFRMESISTAAAVTSITEQIFVCPTVHMLYGLAPVFLAQLGSTIDEIGDGRLGLNLVAGMSPHDRELLGAPELAHHQRYAAATEFTTILRRAWTEERPFDYRGEFFRTEGAWVAPKPIQRPYPLLVNAGLSEAGREFAASMCDWSFVNPPNVREYGSIGPLRDDLQRRAAEQGRRLRLVTQGQVICRDSDDEAEAALQEIVEQADDEVIDAWQDQNRQAFAQGLSRDASRFDSDRARGEGRLFVSGLLLVGSPRTIAERLLEVRRAGLAGLHLGFLDFDELDLFAERVLPLLREAGLR